MSIAICNESSVVYILSDEAKINKWPLVVDGDDYFVVGVPFEPTVIAGVSVSPGVPIQYLHLAEGVIVEDTARWDADKKAVQDAIDAEVRQKAKEARTLAVSQIKVTTSAGHTFDGDEISQGRMARAIVALSTGMATTVNWVLSDNSVIQATPAELVEALARAGMAQAALWVIP